MYPVQLLCQVLRVSRSAYYEWVKTLATKKAGEGKKQTAAVIIAVFQQHRRRYGVRRIIAELKSKGMSVGTYQVRKEGTWIESYSASQLCA